MNIKKIILISLTSFILFDCNNDESVTNETDNLISCEGDIILKTQDEVDTFGQNGCQKIIGSLIIDDTGQLGSEPSDIFDLSPLSNLLEVTGSLIVNNNPNIDNVNGLNNINKIGASLFIEFNENLIEINGFNDLETIGVALSIYENPSLTKIIGFNTLKNTAENGVNIFNANFEIGNNINLTEISGFNLLEFVSSIHMDDNNILTKIVGFNNLTETGEIWFINPITEMNAFNSLEKVSGNFSFWGTELSNMTNFSSLEIVEGNFNIEGNHELENLNGLNNLAVVGGTFRIGHTGFFGRGNHNLGNIEALSNLNSVLSLEIGNNISLSNLNGLQNLTNNVYEIEIVDNSVLSDFCSISQIIQNIGFDSGNVYIFWNGYELDQNNFSNSNCSQ